MLRRWLGQKTADDHRDAPSDRNVRADPDDSGPVRFADVVSQSDERVDGHHAAEKADQHGREAHRLSAPVVDRRRRDQTTGDDRRPGPQARAPCR